MFRCNPRRRGCYLLSCIYDRLNGQKIQIHSRWRHHYIRQYRDSTSRVHQCSHLRSHPWHCIYIGTSGNRVCHNRKAAPKCFRQHFRMSYFRHISVYRRNIRQYQRTSARLRMHLGSWNGRDVADRQDKYTRSRGNG